MRKKLLYLVAKPLLCRESSANNGQTSCPSCGVVQISSSLFRLKQQQPLMADIRALLGIIHLSLQKTHKGDSLRFVLFVSVVTDCVPLYDDVNHFSGGTYISVKELEQENHSCSISGK